MVWVYNAAKKLAQKGWLNVEQQENGSFSYGMHRVICEVLHQKWEIGEYEEEYWGFVESVGKFLDEGNSDLSLRTYLIPFGENLLYYLEKDIFFAKLLLSLGDIYTETYQLKEAMEVIIKH